MNLFPTRNNKIRPQQQPEGEIDQGIISGLEARMENLTVNSSYEQVESVLKDDIKVRLGGIDINGILRGKVISKTKFLSTVKSGAFGFCSVLFGWDLHDQFYYKPSKFSNDANGFADIKAKIDLSTFRRLPFENHIPFFLIDFYDNEEMLSVCPRNLLKSVSDKLNTDFNLKAYAGLEYEYFNYKIDNEENKDLLNLVPISTDMCGYSSIRTNLNQQYFDAIFDDMVKMNIPIEGHHCESGPGVYETALEFQPILQMADNANLFKTFTKVIGRKYGILASFMAKPNVKLPGCSGHVHISLVDQNNSNLFANETGQESEAGKKVNGYKEGDFDGLSDTLVYFLGGLLLAFPGLMPIFAPTINSYKRLVENFWAPVKLSYGNENRLAAIRIIKPPTCSPKSTRLEVRVPGSDSNPHLVLYAILASGYYGIKNEIVPHLPPLRTDEDLKNYPGANLPKTLKEATKLMVDPDSIIKDILGAELVEHLNLVATNEFQKFEQTVTDWELKRYMELI